MLESASVPEPEPAEIILIITLNKRVESPRTASPPTPLSPTRPFLSLLIHSYSKAVIEEKLLRTFDH